MGSGSIQYVSVASGDSSIIISSLIPSTNYSISVAAETNVGLGPYTDSIHSITDGMCYYIM